MFKIKLCEILLPTNRDRRRYRSRKRDRGETDRLFIIFSPVKIF